MYSISNLTYFLNEYTPNSNNGNLSNTSQKSVLDLLNQYILKNYTNITLPDTLTEQWISQNLPDTPMTSEIINVGRQNKMPKI